MTGGAVLGSLFVGLGGGGWGRLVAGGSEGITKGTGVGGADIDGGKTGGWRSLVVTVLVMGRGWVG